MESHRYSMSLPPTGAERKNRWRRVLQRYRFDNAELEGLYQRYIVELQIASIIALLALFLVLTAVLGALNFVFVGHVTVRNIYHISQSGITALILVYIHSRFMKESHMLPITCIIWVLCISFCIVALPVKFGDRPQVKFTPAEGVWQVTLLIFLIYALLPLKIYVAMMTGILLPIAHVIVAIFFAKPHHHWLLWRQVTANLIIFAAVNIAGVYIHDRSEHAQRKAFLDTRNCIAARLDMEDENERLEKLLLSVLPQHVAMEMKAEMLSPNGGLFHTTHIQKYDHVSILFADIVGFTSLAQQCSSHELVKILNEIVSKFDSIAEDNHCLRIKMLGDNYFCVSGLPEARNDHAQCAVTMGIDMIDVMAALREATDVDLETRIGIHTGSVVTGVIGLKKWQYDAWSDDVLTAYEVQLAGTPGRVLVSRAVVDHLCGSYQAEPALTPEKNTYLHDHGIETFYILAAHPRKCLSLVRQTNSGRGSHLRNMQNPVLRLLAVLKFSAEPPFAHVYRTLRPTDDGAAARPVQGQIGDITKKPYKKRTSLQRPCADRVNGYLANAITTRSVKREKRDHVNLFTLRFKRSIRERMYQGLADTSFATSMLCTLIMLVCVTTVQAIVLPRTLLLLALFLVTFSWVCIVLIIVLGTKLRCCGCNVQKSWSIRLIITLITVLLIYAVAQVNVFCCRGGLLFAVPAVVDESMTPAPGPLIAFKSNEHLVCEMPEYIYISGILGYIAMAVFFKMAAIAKLCLMLIMAAGYLVVLEFTHIALFTELDEENSPDVPSHVGGILALLFFVLCLYIHSRHQEWTYRLDFLWKNQATMEKIDTTELQNNNRQILCNLLPAHVAAHFVEVCQRTNLELFSQAYQRVGVIFVSMPNFVPFYIEMSNERRATEALQVLQNVVADFDELLHEDRFRGIDKIKTCGTVYMAAVGLSPERMIQDDEDSISGQLSVLMEFYFSMRAKLQYINENAGYSFQLRAGAHIGPVVAAVVGARRPQFDLFGNTVNMASTMETTGQPDQLQVTDDIYQPLVLKYEFLSRGPMSVKHVGSVGTYFLVSRKTPYSPMSQPMMPSLTGLAWKDGVQLRNPAKRMSIHEMINRRSRPVSFHLSRENVNHIMVPSGQMPGSDSPLLSRAQPSGTPTGSLNRMRSESGAGGSGGGSRDNMPRPNESPFQNLSSFQENPGVRVESPELPVVHFRNVNMQGSDSLGRTKEAPTNSRNLTQSQILHARCESRCQSRGSISSRNDTTSPLTTAPLTTDGLVSSSGYSPTTSPSSLVTSPESPANNLDWKLTDQTFGSDHSRYENATNINSPKANKLTTPPTKSKGKLRENVYENVQNDLNIVNGGPSSNVNRDDLAALNNIIKDIGPTDKSFGYEHNLYQPEQYNHANGYAPILSVNQYLYGGSGSRGARPKTLATSEEQQNLLPSQSPVDSGPGHPITAAYLSKLCQEPYRRPPDIPCSNKPRKESVSSSSEPMSPLVSSSSMCTPSSPLFTPDRLSSSSRRSSADARIQSPEARLPPASPGRKHSLGSRMPPAQLRLLPMGLLQKQHSLPESSEPPLVDYRPLFDTLPLPTREANPHTIPEDGPLENHTGTYPPEIRKLNVQMEDKGVGTDDRKGRRSGRSRKSPQKTVSKIPVPGKSGKASPPPLPPPPPEECLPPPKSNSVENRMVGPLSATNTATHQALVFINPANSHKPTNKPYDAAKLLGGGTEYSAFKPINVSVSNNEDKGNNSSESPRTSSGARPKHRAVETAQENPDSRGSGNANTPSDVSGGESTTKRPPAPPFQVKRRQKVQAPLRMCKSLDYIPSDLEDSLSVTSRPDSPDDGENSARSSLLDHYEGFPSLSILTRHLADNISLSSVGSSEMSRSDPALNYDSASTAYESEYDNYRPGMASDEDYFIPEPISDIDIDMFDDINVDDVTVSDTYSLDLPLSLMQSNLRIPDKEKKVTDV